MQIDFEGSGESEKGYWTNRETSADRRVPIVAVDRRYFRPTEVETLLGDPTKARLKLGWQPRISFSELVAEMAREDLRSAERDELVNRHGFKSRGYHE